MSYINVRLSENGRTERIDFPNRLELAGEGGRRFRLQKAVQSGGNGVIFEADCLLPDGSNEGLVAVKLLKDLNSVRQDRFDNEIRILRELDHPKITKCFGAGRELLGAQQIEVPWMAMSLGDENLRKHMDNRGGPLEPRKAISVCKQLCEALSHFHDKGILHRDLKPANVVWQTDEDRENIFLIDFGIAKYFDEDVSGRKMDDLTGVTEFVGPSNWASPELLEYARDKSHPVGLKSDLFQVGLILWFLTTNRIGAGIPSKRQDPTEGRIYDVVTGLLHEDPDDREFSSAQEIIDRLEVIRKKL